MELNKEQSDLTRNSPLAGCRALGRSVSIGKHHRKVFLAAAYIRYHSRRRSAESGLSLGKRM